MGQYRISRNIEASLIRYVATLVAADWTGVTVEKSYARAYDTKVPVICIRMGTTIHNKVEIGSEATIREPQIFIDIMGSDDGNRLDLKDYLVEKLKAGMPYNQYIITAGQISSEVCYGKLRVLKIDDRPIDFDTDKDKLDVHDRYRHLLVLTVSLGKPESAGYVIWTPVTPSNPNSPNITVISEDRSDECDSHTTQFILTETPMANSVQVYLNGLLQQIGAGKDYTLSNKTVAFAIAPAPGDILIINYLITG